MSLVQPSAALYSLSAMVLQWSFWQKQLPCQKCTLPATNYCTSMELYLPYPQVWYLTLRYGTCHYMQGLYFMAFTVPNLYSSFLLPKTPICLRFLQNLFCAVTYVNQSTLKHPQMYQGVKRFFDHIFQLQIPCDYVKKLCYLLHGAVSFIWLIYTRTYGYVMR